MSTTEIVTAVEAALAELDALRTTDAIAQRLIELGHVGTPCGSVVCPVARFVQAQTGVRFSLDRMRWGVDDGGREIATGAVPRNVGRFVGDFDGGVFPDLIDSKVTDHV